MGEPAATEATARDDLPPAPGHDAALLAELLSTAVRIEPELMRAVRITYLPHTDVGIESELWFSHWASSRSATSMALLPAVRDVLQRDLAERLARCREGDRLPGLGDTVERFHRHLSPLVRLEEKATWLSLGGDEAALARAERELRRALHALVEERRNGVADWLLSAWHRLPERLLRTVTGWQMGSLVAHLDAEAGVRHSAPAGLTRAHAATVIDAVTAAEGSEVPDIPLPVRMSAGVLTVGRAVADAPGTVLIPVPLTDPVVLELSDDGTGWGGGEVLLVPLGGTVSRPGCPPGARLITARHQVFDPSGAAHGLLDPAVADPAVPAPLIAASGALAELGVAGLDGAGPGVAAHAPPGADAVAPAPVRGGRREPRASDAGTAAARPPVPVTVLVGRPPDTRGYPRWVYFLTLAGLADAGYRVHELGALQRGMAAESGTRARGAGSGRSGGSPGPGDGSGASGGSGRQARPGEFHAAVVLLDPAEIRSPMAREQLDILFSWCASGGPAPVLVALGGLRHAEGRGWLPAPGRYQWLSDADVAVARHWRADFRGSRAHAGEVASRVVAQVRRSVVGTTAPTGRAGRVPSPDEVLARTASQYLHRYAATGDRDDLRRALGRYKTVVPRLRAEDPDDAAALIRFARALRYRAVADGAVADIVRAVGILRRVLREEGDASSSWVRTEALLELLRVLHARLRPGLAHGHRDPAGLRDAGRSGDMSGPGGVGGLRDTGGPGDGDGLRGAARGAGADGDEALLAEAEAEAEERAWAALTEAPPGGERADLVACLTPLAAAVARRDGDPGRLRLAAALWLETAETDRTSSGPRRAVAARNAADLAFEGGALDLALTASGRFFDLAEELDWTRLAEDEFRRAAEGFSGIPENAAACALSAGDPVTALELLERGLRLHRVILARRAVDRVRGGSFRPQRLRRLRRETSLLSPRLSGAEFRANAAHGPVVVLNAAAVRSDAIIVAGDGITTVPLPDAGAEAVRDGRLAGARLHEALAPAMAELRRRLPAAGVGGPSWVWWCPTGPLSRLPVHQAFSSGTGAGTGAGAGADAGTGAEAGVGTAADGGRSGTAEGGSAHPRPVPTRESRAAGDTGTAGDAGAAGEDRTPGGAHPAREAGTPGEVRAAGESRAAGDVRMIEGARTGQAAVPEVVSSYITGPAMLLEQRLTRTPAFLGTRHRKALVVVSHPGDDVLWDRRAQAETAAVCESGVDFDVLRGPAATRAAVLEALSQVPVAHVVCRLVMSPDRGTGRTRGTGIALADGLLTASDLAAADLATSQLIFLSGPGEAVGSGTEPDRDTLAAAVHAAGCRHVVTVLGNPREPWPPYIADPAPGDTGGGGGTRTARPDTAGDGPAAGTVAWERSVGAVAARIYSALADDDRRPQPDRVPLALHRVLTGVRPASGGPQGPGTSGRAAGPVEAGPVDAGGRSGPGAGPGPVAGEWPPLIHIGP